MDKQQREDYIKNLRENTENSAHAFYCLGKAFTEQKIDVEDFIELSASIGFALSEVERQNLLEANRHIKKKHRHGASA